MPKVTMGSSPSTILLLMILFIEGVVTVPRITRVSPYRIGNGGARISIFGVGFTEDQFNFFDKTLETRIILTNDVSSQECEVVRYYSNAEKIECETGPRKVMAGSTWYRVHLTADGVEASNSGSHSVQFRSDYAPYITEVSPKTGPPGIVVTLDGKFFTDQYQQLGTFDEEADEPPIITGIRMGHRECDMLMDDGVTPYGLSTESLTCKMKGSYVGDYGATVYVSGHYGTSELQPSAKKVSVSGELFAYQAYPVISDISPTVGSTEGGTLITITGQGFNAQPGKTKIRVGGEECQIEKASSGKVTCRTPVEPASPITEIKGGRGLRYEVWNGTVAADLSDLSALTPSTSGYSSEILDRSEGLIIDGDPAGYTARLSAIFTAPEDAMYEFSLTSQGEAILSISNASLFTVMREIATLTASGGTKKSDLMHLEKGECYYMEAVHKGASANGQVKIGLRRPQTDYTPSDTADSQLEKQTLYVKPREVLHEQTIIIVAPENATANFKFVYEGVASETVAFKEGVDKTEEGTTPSF